MRENARRGEVPGRCRAGEHDQAKPAVAPGPRGGAAPQNVPWAGPERDRSMMDPARRAEAVLGLCRAAHQLQDVAGMVATGQYCADVLGELRRARDALDAINAVVTRNYLQRCVPVAVRHDDPFIYDELMRVLDPRP